LSENLQDESLRKFYYKFMVSEAGHYRLFIDLATKYYTEQHVRDKWQQWLNAETEVLQLLVPRGDRMH
jgi:tRNA-(ms[2]io[6]A)-hydroxylase